MEWLIILARWIFPHNLFLPSQITSCSAINPSLVALAFTFTFLLVPHHNPFRIQLNGYKREWVQGRGYFRQTRLTLGKLGLAGIEDFNFQHYQCVSAWATCPFGLASSSGEQYECGRSVRFLSSHFLARRWEDVLRRITECLLPPLLCLQSLHPPLHVKVCIS